jgi:uncharacterized protein involved in exopolysaccharide biosynthesis
MKTQPEVTLVIQDLPRIFSKYRRLIIKGSLLGLTVFLIAAYVLPSKYKVHFNLTIYAKYFQSPLIGDFIPGLNESGEMRSQRESLIRQALTPEFLDSLGEKYGIYPSSHKGSDTLSTYQALRSRLKSLLVMAGLYQPINTESQRSAERQDLLSHILIFDLNSNTFNVSFTNSSPDVAYNATKDIYTQVIQNLLDIRQRSLFNVRDAIRNRLNSLESSTSMSAGPITPARPGEIQQELTEVRYQISLLSSQYTDEHPRMKELRERERLLLSRMNNSPQGRVQPMLIPMKLPEDGESSREINGDLMKKLNYLNIAIDSDQQHQADYFATSESPIFPTSPLFPKKSLFALWGLALGLFGSLFVASLLEYFDRSALHAGVLAQQLGVSLLGELPVFSWKTPPLTPMIQAPQQKMTGRD